MTLSSASAGRAIGVREPGLRVTALGVFAFFAGLMNPLILNLVGDVYGAELLLPVAGLWAFFSRGGDSALRQRLFWSLMIAAAITLAGYILSDFIRDTRADQYLRGWGRILLLVADLFALSLLFLQDRRNLWWFALGMGIGGVLYLRLMLHMPISVWKFGYAEPMLLVAAALGRFLPVRLAAVWLGLLGAASMWFDYRSFAAIAFLLAAYVWVRAARPRQSLAGGRRFVGLVAAGAVAGVLVLGMLSLTDSEYSAQRRAQSNAGRSAAFEVGLIAIARSPLIGYGSWTENRELAELFTARYQEKRGIRDPNARSGHYFAPHSQLLQSWVEGGVLGAAFFLYLGYHLLRRVSWTVLARPVDMLTPLVLYLLVSCAWHLVMSPFSAPHRIHIALGAAILVLVESELRAARLEMGRRAVPGTRAAGSRFPDPELPVTHGRDGHA